MEKNDLSMEDILKQESELQFSQFTNETALELGLLLVENAKKNHYPIAIDIRRNNQKLFYYAFEGASIDNEYWVEGKSRVVQRYGTSSHYQYLLLQSRGLNCDLPTVLGENDYAICSGAFPIIIKNVGVVGSIAISGIFGAVKEHNFVPDTIREFLAKSASK